jgi:hypothetical protein
MQFVFAHVISVTLLISVAQIHGQTQAEMNAVANSGFSELMLISTKLINRFWQSCGIPRANKT